MTHTDTSATRGDARSSSAQRARGLRVQRACAWAGPLFIVAMAIGFVAIGKMIPPPPPGDSATQTADFFLGNADRIRFGMIASAFAAALLVPLSTVIALQMRRTEGRYPALSLIQFASGVLLSLEFIYLIFFWQVAAFRQDRAPELVQLLNDMAWVPYIGLSGTVVMQVAAFGAAVLLDTRTVPVFPRWFGYYQLWAALLFTPGTFNVFFHDGALAWDGMVAFYLPIAVYVSWAVLTPIFVFRAIRHQEAEEAGLGDNEETSLGQLALEIAQLRAEIAADRSSRSAGAS
jgi:hypothetical protein